MARPTHQTPTQRRRVLRRTFEANLDREWRRYGGAPRRRLFRTLRERFLARHMAGVRGTVLEVGPGPGRFTPLIRACRPERLLVLDLSRPALVAGRRRADAAERDGRTARLQGAGEHLPVRDRSVDALVAFGNIAGMASHDGPRLFAEWARVLRPGGRLLLDFASPAGSLQEFLHSAAERRFLLKLLRDPARYFLGQILVTGFQPHAPDRMARWEFRFYTPPEVHEELARAGFRVTDLMSVAPVSAFQDAVPRLASRERRAWETLIRLEEAVGRRPGTGEMGLGLVVAAVRSPVRRGRRRRRTPAA